MYQQVSLSSWLKLSLLLVNSERQAQCFQLPPVDSRKPLSTFLTASGSLYVLDPEACAELAHYSTCAQHPSLSRGSVYMWPVIDVAYANYGKVVRVPKARSLLILHYNDVLNLVFL